MAETANIARIAELISDEIFQEFGWEKVGPTNVNWECIAPDVHDLQSHPSDVVFFYEEPFRDVRTYIQTDLKSYSTESISKSIIGKSIISLAKQVACAERSEEWQDRYVHSHVTYEVSGMLFVYNHDNGYDRDFRKNLEDIEKLELDIPQNSKIVVLGPEDIYWLHNVGQAIQNMRGKPGLFKLPEKEYCSFFYPQPVRKAFVRSGEITAANLEMLTGPWIILRYQRAVPNPGTAYVIFYNRAGETSDEFLYLIDYIRQHEMLHENNLIIIRSIDKTGVAINNFQKARQQYIEQIGGSGSENGIHKLIDGINYLAMNALVPSFSQIQIGMDYDR